MSLIGFIGSVFSPWFAWSGRSRPANNCCLNVVTYGPGGRWAMTDRGEAALDRSAARIGIGPSSMSWDGTAVTIEVDERTWPHMTRMRGQVRLIPSAITEVELPLTPDGAHIWRPLAPTARIEVRLGRHGEWDGHGYLDSNFGTRPLEADFSYWTWGRFPTGDGSVCFYDPVRRDGTRMDFAAMFGADGSAEAIEPPAEVPLRRSLWGVRRRTRGDAGTRARQTRAMLDTPFYTRSAVMTTLGGRELEGVHEAIDLRRFASPILKPMIALKVPRRAGWRATPPRGSAA